MLDAYIIEWLKQKEKEQAQEEQRPFLEIPLEEPVDIDKEENETVIQL